jgi:DNA-binding LacI/PurR family transcriptional regulator
MPKVKLQDIARICGVDISTVSRAMRGDPKVKEVTRLEIEETARRLGYRPNLLARNLAGGKTRTLWLILPSVDASIDHRLVRHASHAAIQHGYTLFAALHDCDNFGSQAENDLANYERVLDMAAQGTTDGVLIVPRRGADDVALLQGLVRQNFPLVFLDNYVESLPNPVVTTENQDAAQALTIRCLEAGATGAILLFEEPNPIARARLAGARAVLAQHRIRYVTQTQWDENPDVAAHGLGTCVAVIGSSQTGHVAPLIARHASTLAHRDLIFGVFDQWTGEPTPAKKVFVAIQDCESLANHAIERLVALIEKQTGVEDRFTRVPLQDITVQTPTFASA